MGKRIEPFRLPLSPQFKGVYSWPLAVNQSRMIVSESCELHLLREGLSKTG